MADQTENAAATATPTETPQAPATDVATETKPRPQPRDLPAGEHWFWGTGRRKTSVARARIRPGKGHFLINGRRVEQFFSELQDRNDMHAPLKLTKTEGNLDVYVKVIGGGLTGQAEAIRVALSRALEDYDPSTEDALRDAGFLTVDARRVERKKYGQPGARRRFQFSKR